MHEFPVFPVFPAVRLARLACVVGAVWSLMACQPTAPAGAPGTAAAQSTGAPKNDKSAQEHLYRVNPAPKEGFEVEFEIHDAPGPFAEFGGNAHYQSFNCNYVTSEWAGTRSEPRKMVPLVVSRVDERRYRATFYLDAMNDEDYYGTGVCKWAMTSMALHFSASGAKDDSTYVVSLNKQAWRDGGTATRYYWKGDYPQLPGVPDTGNTGRDNADDYSPKFRANLFSITARVKALKP